VATISDLIALEALRRKQGQSVPIGGGGPVAFAGDLKRSAVSLADLVAGMGIDLTNSAVRGLYGIYGTTPLRKFGDVRLNDLDASRDDVISYMADAPLQIPNPFPMTEAGQSRAITMGNAFDRALKSDLGRSALGLRDAGERKLTDWLGVEGGGTAYAALATGLELAGPKGTARITLDPTEVVARATRLVNRKPGVGQQKNARRVLQDPNGQLPPIAVGRIDTQDWLDRVNANLSPDEIVAARHWYREAKGLFDEAFGAERSDLMLAAWLLGNKNESPSGALRNMLRVAEQIESGWRKGPKRKKGGLSDGAIRELLEGGDITSGVGRKLFDFMDSEAGRPFRTYYGNDPRAGSPFVVDIWSFRDAGYIDDVLMNYLQKNGYDTKGLDIDNAAGPSNTQYENAAQQFRQRTQELNDAGWLGGDLSPVEVQAIGWTAMQRAMQKAPESIDDAIQKNLRRVAYEIAPGRRSEYNRLFGDRLYALPVAEQARVANELTGSLDAVASNMLGVQSGDLMQGSGGWRLYDPQPSTVNHMISSPETAELYSNIVGYLGQQESVWTAKTKGFTSAPKGYGVVLTGKNLGDDQVVRSLWTSLVNADQTGTSFVGPLAGNRSPFVSRSYNERAKTYREKHNLKPRQKLPDAVHKQFLDESRAENALLQGYMPVVAPDGTPGIMVLIDRGGKTTFNQIESDLRKTIESVIKDGPDDTIDMRILEAEITKAGNPTGDRFSGQTYLSRISQLGRGDLIPVLRDYRGQFTQEFDRVLRGAEARQGSQATAIPDFSGSTQRSAAKELSPLFEDDLARFDDRLKATAPH
jgi:hypothetical protein